jgi:hypothetical protein
MLQKRYEGFLKTPQLFLNKSIFDLIPFKISSQSNSIKGSIDNHLRLGKYVERLVAFELSQHSNISVLAENVQIQEDKTTLGELDCLLTQNSKSIHLEIIYKFYVYDDTVGYTEIDHFIGPNRKDSLTEKLVKLKDKQLPLLYSDACKHYLDRLNLEAKNISQEIYFKAQLFLPFSKQDIKLKDLNPECVIGFYVKITELEQFEGCKFFIPSKKDWLVLPHTHVNWLNFNDFISIITDYNAKQYSVLFWAKLKSGELKKLFFVWW